MDIKKELGSIKEKYGRLKAHDVLEEAKGRQPGDPLHDHFEWDDDKAGEAYRLHQARQLVGRYKIIAEDEVSGSKRIVRATVSVVNSDGGREYELKPKVLSHKHYRTQFLHEALDALAL